MPFIPTVGRLAFERATPCRRGSLRHLWAPFRVGWIDRNVGDRDDAIEGWGDTRHHRPLGAYDERGSEDHGITIAGIPM